MKASKIIASRVKVIITNSDGTSTESAVNIPLEIAVGIVEQLFTWRKDYICTMETHLSYQEEAKKLKKK